MKIADPILMREINKFHVLEAIRMAGQISRVEISEQTYLSGTTVSAITAALIEEGLIGAVHTQPNGQSGRGRPRVLLQLIAEAVYTIGVMITERKTFASLANFRGEAVHSLSLPVDISRWGKDVVADIVEDTVRECISQSGVDASKIKGIGIGTSGLIDPSSTEPSLNRQQLDYEIAISQELTKRTNLTVKIERSANLIALARGWFEPGGRDRSLTIVTVGEKVDIGCIVQGELYRGTSSQGLAIGQTKVVRTGARQSESALANLDELFSRFASSQAAATIDENGGGSGKINARDATNALVKYAEAGNDQAIEFFREQGNALGQSVAQLINLINPHQILIYFENPEQQHFIEREFNKSVSDNSAPHLLASVEVTCKISSDEDSLRGAVALILQDIYNSPWTMR